MRNAISKISGICGQDIYRALRNGTLQISSRDLIDWAGQKDEAVIKRLFSLMIDNRDWGLGDALRYAKDEAARELSPEELKCQELLEQVTRLCCAQVLEAFERRNSLDAKQAFTTQLYEVLPPLLPYEPRTGESVKKSPDEKSPTPPESKQPATELEDAIERIGKACGTPIAQALRDHTLQMPVRDIIRWSQLSPRTMQDCAPYIIDQRWTLAQAMKYEEDKLSNAFAFLTKRKKS